MNVDRPVRHLRMPWQKRSDILPEDSEPRVSRRVPFLGFLPLSIKNDFVAMSGKFTGTFLFLLFAFGGTNAFNTALKQGQPTNLTADPTKLLFISLCFGMSLAVNAWVFFRISGGLFNPLFRSDRLWFAYPSQMESALLKAFSSKYFFTAQLVFTIFMLAAEKHRATFIAPVGIGLSLFIAELFGVYYTGSAVNPARAFGHCVVVKSFYHYHWICWVGSMLGSVLASGFYMFIKALEYETVNPDQDEAGPAGEHFNPLTQNEKPNPLYKPHYYVDDNLTVNRNGEASAANINGITNTGDTDHNETTRGRGPDMKDGRTLTESRS